MKLAVCKNCGLKISNEWGAWGHVETLTSLCDKTEMGGRILLFAAPQSQAKGEEA